MTYLVEVPVEGGGRLVVEASDWQLPGDLELALSLGAEGGVVVAKGTTEVHFTVTVEWNTGDQEE